MISRQKFIAMEFETTWEYKMQNKVGNYFVRWLDDGIIFRGRFNDIELNKMTV